MFACARNIARAVYLTCVKAPSQHFLYHNIFCFCGKTCSFFFKATHNVLSSLVWNNKKCAEKAELVLQLSFPFFNQLSCHWSSNKVPKQVFWRRGVYYVSFKNVFPVIFILLCFDSEKIWISWALYYELYYEHW